VSNFHMRRKWIVWGTTGVLLTVVGFCIAAIPAATPFEFIPCGSRVTLKPTAEDAAWLKRLGNAYSIQIYTFKADFKQVLARATRELTGKGFVTFGPTVSGQSVSHGTRFAEYRFIKPAGPTQVGPSKWPPKVVLYDNMRVVKPGFDDLTPSIRNEKRGWVTVVIEGAGESTWLERLGSMLGF
jgi:hypothetical protein